MRTANRPNNSAGKRVLCDLQRAGFNIASPRIRTGDGIYEALQHLIELRIVNPGRDGQNPHALPLMKRCIFKPRRPAASRDHQ